VFTKQKWKKEKQSFTTKYGKKGTQLGDRYVNCKLQLLRKNQQLGAQQKQQNCRGEEKKPGKNQTWSSPKQKEKWREKAHHHKYSANSPPAWWQ
jgi:hypothetical protein